MGMTSISDLGLERIVAHSIGYVLGPVTLEDIKHLTADLQKRSRRIRADLRRRRAQDLAPGQVPARPVLSESDQRIVAICNRILDEIGQFSNLKHWLGSVSGNLMMGTSNEQAVMTDFVKVVDTMVDLSNEANAAYQEAISSQPAVSEDVAVGEE